MYKNKIIYTLLCPIIYKGIDNRTYKNDTQYETKKNINPIKNYDDKIKELKKIYDCKEVSKYFDFNITDKKYIDELFLIFINNLKTNVISNYYLLSLYKDNDILFEKCIMEFLKHGKIIYNVYNFEFILYNDILKQNVFNFSIYIDEDIYNKIFKIFEKHKLYLYNNIE